MMREKWYLGFICVSFLMREVECPFTCLNPLNLRSPSARCPMRLLFSLLSLLLSLLAHGANRDACSCPQPLPGLFSEVGRVGTGVGIGWSRDGDKVLAPMAAASSFDAGTEAPDQILIK